ncbi:NEQ546 [Nanoarchaeum equitans Kin4-M]|uniref:Large ribosomal subunit protein uL1 n=1 Tax=Nanoarchaeum equitans (strain Kin4-M) TaxID=228908 RepID=RL1_NANEQ|nr:RecName: Full=Large ribosomal subunit protein uL1; AltName: Full=50S ribosomal protein L1 [Nanoarchaeum equitans Kin4-M]AAR39387.1 NEQ546 [Nanoarchaeum equitans Kin4-M]
MVSVDQVKKAREGKKRRFTQTFELIFNLKNVDLRKYRLSTYIVLPRGRGKKMPILAIVGPENKELAEKYFDIVLTREDLKQLDKRTAKKLAKRHYHVVAQADLMPELGKSLLGRFLGIRGKMPNPKAGQILPPNLNEKMLEALREKLNNTVRVNVKKHVTFGVPIGTEDMEDEAIAENADTVINEIISQLPQGKQNIDSVYLKLTMGPAVRVL